MGIKTSEHTRIKRVSRNGDKKVVEMYVKANDQTIIE